MSVFRYKDEILVFQDMVRDVPYTELDHATFWIEFIERHHEVSNSQFHLINSFIYDSSCSFWCRSTQCDTILLTRCYLLPYLFTLHYFLYLISSSLFLLLSLFLLKKIGIKKKEGMIGFHASVPYRV